MSSDLTQGLPDLIQQVSKEQRIALTETQEEGIVRYVQLIMRWNRRIRLTGSRNAQEFVRMHLADGLVLARAIKEASTEQENDDGVGRLIDVGTGAGLPGVIIALVSPRIRVTLCDQSEKKTALLLEAQRRLEFPGTIVWSDVRKLAPEAPFDHAVARATFPPLEWVELAQSLVREGGSIWLMLTQQQGQAWTGAGETTRYQLSDGRKRTIVRITRRVSGQKE